jgi:hypothetical protein
MTIYIWYILPHYQQGVCYLLVDRAAMSLLLGNTEEREGMTMANDVNVPDGLEGWQISAARVAALWSYPDLAETSGVALSGIQRIEMLSPIIVRREGRKVEGSADEATIANLLRAFAKVGLELRPVKGSTPAAVVCVDPERLAKRRAQEVRDRAKARA